MHRDPGTSLTLTVEYADEEVSLAALALEVFEWFPDLDGDAKVRVARWLCARLEAELPELPFGGPS